MCNTDQTHLLSSTKLKETAWAAAFQTFGPYTVTATQNSRTPGLSMSMQTRVHPHRECRAPFCPAERRPSRITVQADAAGVLIESVSVTAAA